MIFKNKKGLSTIVTTLLFVVLGLVAIGGVWMTVRTLLKDNSDQVQTSSLTINLDSINAYEESGVVNVRVTRLVGAGELTKIKFILDDGSDKEVITKEVVNFQEYDTLDFVLNPTKLVPSTIETVSIVPVFNSGNQEMVGSVTDVQTLRNLYALGEGDGGEEDPLCVNNCGLKICGASPNGCGGANECGTCLTGTCNETQLTCDNCVPLTLPCTGGKICGTQSNGCGGTLNCGDGCVAGTLCNTTQLTCDTVVALNEGTVEDTWPGTSGLYFGSSSLPINVNYQGKYIKFLESEETGCSAIASYTFPVEGYSKSHIKFSFETLIQSNDSYQIFNTYNECDATI